jgi:hypothetical protein
VSKHLDGWAVGKLSGPMKACEYGRPSEHDTTGPGPVFPIDEGRPHCGAVDVQTI